MDDPDEERMAIERDYRRKMRFLALLGGLGLLWIVGKLLSVHLNLPGG